MKKTWNKKSPRFKRRDVRRFIRLNNRFSGIGGEVLSSEVDAYIRFLELRRPNVADLELLGRDIAGAEVVRNVEWTRYYMVYLVDNCLPWKRLVEFLKLSPMDHANGRIARVIWLWLVTRSKDLRTLDARFEWFHQAIEYERVGDSFLK